MFGLKPKPKPYSKEWWLQCRADYFALLHFVDDDPIRGIGGFYRLIVEEALNLPAQEDIISLRVFNKEIIQSIDSIPNDCMLLFVQLEIIHIKEEKLPFKGSYADHALSRIGLSEPRLLTFTTWLNSHPGMLSTALCTEHGHKEQIMRAIEAHEGLSVFVPYFNTRCSRRRLNGLIKAFDRTKRTSENSSGNKIAANTQRHTDSKYQGSPMTPEQVDQFATRMAKKLMSDPTYLRSQMTPEERRRNDSAEMLAAAITAGIGLILTPVLIGIPILLYAVYRMFAIFFRV